jgi:hypothetical protein
METDIPSPGCIIIQYRLPSIPSRSELYRILPGIIGHCKLQRSVDVPPILSSYYYPPFPYPSDSSHIIVHSSTRTRLSAVPLRGPPWSAVVRRPPWPAARRVLPCMYYCIKRLTAVCIYMLRYALTVLCPRARRAYGAASIRMGITGTCCDLSNICPRRKWGNYS